MNEKQMANIAPAFSDIDPEQPQMANSLGLPMAAPPDRGDGNTPGQVYAANASKFTESFFQEPLTQYALGWGAQNPEVADTLEFLAPRVPTGRYFQYAYGTVTQGLLSETDDVRAIGADFKRVEYTSAKTTGKTYNKGLTVRVDMDEVEGMANWQQVFTGRLMRRLQLNELRRGVVLLLAAGHNNAVTWDTTAGKEPDADVIAALVLGSAATGNLGPNRALYGITAWQKRQLALMAQSHAGGFAKCMFTPAQLAQFLGLDGARISKEVYNVGGTAATTIGTVLDTTVGTTGLAILYRAEPGMTTDDPSNIKRFVSATPSGDFRVYLMQSSAKMWDLTVEHYSNIVITSSTGVEKMTVS